MQALVGCKTNSELQEISNLAHLESQEFASLFFVIKKQCISNQSK